MRIGCYPGSFDPLTVAHLAIADAAVGQCGLTRLDLVLSRSALGKADHEATLEERVAAIAAVRGDDRPWLDVVVTDDQYLADIAAGYDVLVLGADKWRQVIDPAFYRSAKARNDAVARLPHVACAPRRGLSLPPRVTVLDVPDWIGEVSSTAVRAGAEHWRAGPAEPQTRRNPE